MFQYEQHSRSPRSSRRLVRTGSDLAIPPPTQIKSPDLATFPRPVRHASVSALRAARPSSPRLDHRHHPPCPLCGAAPGPARVTLAKRRLFAADSSITTTTTAARVVAGLHAELEAERAAAADAACEAMSMILRLQRDKSEAMMEARQYRRYAEERFAHDAAEADALRAAVARRDAAVRALAARLRDCQATLLHLGYDPLSPSPVPSSPTPAPAGAAHAIQDHHDDGNYPSIQCLDPPPPADVGTPRTHHLLNRTPGPEPDHNNPPVCGSPSHARTPSNDSISYDVALGDEYHPLYATTDRGAPDEEMDRVYTVDAVHGAPVVSASWDEEEAEIQKLKARLQALEADRESMRSTIISMGDDKVLLREVAQRLCKQGAVPMRPQPVALPQRRLVKRRPGFVKVFIATVIKWIASIFCWRKKSNRIKYPIGLCGSNIGLMLVLDRYRKQRRRKFLKKEPSADIH